MKNIHYINIGTAKAGTSAVFDTLCQHPSIDHDVAQGDKENFGYSHYNWSLKKYIEYYNNYNVSLNFNVSQWTMESKQIQEFDSAFTHASIIVRNPFDYIESYYNFLSVSKNHSPQEFVDQLLEINSLDYAKIVNRWISLSRQPFLILFYDDLTSNPAMFYNRITDFIGIDRYKFNTSKRVNVTSGSKISVIPTKKQTSKINSLIDQFENLSQRSLTHWKL